MIGLKYEMRRKVVQSTKIPYQPQGGGERQGNYSWLCSTRYMHGQISWLRKWRLLDYSNKMACSKNTNVRVEIPVKTMKLGMRTCINYTTNITILKGSYLAAESCWQEMKLLVLLWSLYLWKHQWKYPHRLPMKIRVKPDYHLQYQLWQCCAHSVFSPSRHACRLRQDMIGGFTIGIFTTLAVRAWFRSLHPVFVYTPWGYGALAVGIICSIERFIFLRKQSYIWHVSSWTVHMYASGCNDSRGARCAGKLALQYATSALQYYLLHSIPLKGHFLCNECSLSCVLRVKYKHNLRSQGYACHVCQSSLKKSGQKDILRGMTFSFTSL